MWLWPAMPLIAGATLWRGEWWLGWPALGATVLGLLALPNLVVDGDAITLAPVIPLLPRRRFRFEDLGPFTASDTFSDWWNRSSGGARVQAEILRGPSFWATYLFPSRTLTLGARYGPGYRSRAFEAPELAAILEAYRVNES